jgi:hypothetical protein
MTASLPDAYAESRDGNTLLVANKKARKVLEKVFSKPRPRWGTVGGEALTSPEYRAIEVEDGPAPQVMLAAVHQAGLRVMFKCATCPEHHILDDAMAERFVKEAEALGQRVMHPRCGDVAMTKRLERIFNTQGFNVAVEYALRDTAPDERVAAMRHGAQEIEREVRWRQSRAASAAD